MRSLYSSADARFAIDGRLIVCHLFGEGVDGANFDMARMLDIELRNPQGRAVLVVCSERSGSPGPIARETLGLVLTGHAPRILAGAVVIEGTGFRAAAKRSVATSVRLPVRNAYPQAIFGDVPAASIWLSARVPELSPESIRYIFDQLSYSKAA